MNFCSTLAWSTGLQTSFPARVFSEWSKMTPQTSPNPSMSSRQARSSPHWVLPHVLVGLPRNSFRAGLHLGRGEVPEPPGPPQRSVHGTDPAGRAKDHHLEVGLSSPASNVDTTLLMMGSCFLLLTGWRPEALRAQSYPGSFSFALAHPLGGREAGRARTILESPVILEISEGRPNKGAKYRRILTSHAENWMKTVLIMFGF